MAEDLPLAGPASVVALATGVRLHHDPVRGRDLLLAPERAVALDEIGVAILGAVDGSRSLADIAALLAPDYDAAPEAILGDILDFAAAFAARGLLTVRS